jgi:flagellar protein FliL
MSGNTAKAGEAQDKKNGKGKLFIIIGLMVALAGGGGGYYWYAKKAAEESDDSADTKGKKVVVKAPTFVALEPFTVNLSDTNAERMAQIAVSLQVSDQKVEESIKAYMPALRHDILKVISAKESKEILNSEGKDRLAAEIAVVAAERLGWKGSDDEEDDEDVSSKGANKESNKDSTKKKKKKAKVVATPNPIDQVHFSQFIVQ